MPTGTIAALLTYPNAADAAQAETHAQILKTVGLGDYVDRLGEEAEWRSILSPGEQQRFAAARALIRRPDYLFLDEATSALDLKLEASLYEALIAALPTASIVSVAHRATTVKFHTSTFEVTAGGLRPVPNGE
jgi:putative ATP-binding cassette transporter